MMGSLLCCTSTSSYSVELLCSYCSLIVATGYCGATVQPHCVVETVSVRCPELSPKGLLPCMSHSSRQRHLIGQGGDIEPLYTVETTARSGHPTTRRLAPVLELVHRPTQP